MSRKPAPPSKPSQPEPELRHDGLSPSEHSMADAIVAALEERQSRQEEASGSQWRLVKRLIAAKDIILFVVTIGSVLYGAFVLLGELQAKPSSDQMQEAIEQRVKPVEDVATTNARAVERVETDVGKVKKKVDRIEDVQSYQLEQQAWEGEVLEHLGSKKRGKAPARPPELKKKERELLQK